LGSFTCFPAVHLRSQENDPALPAFLPIDVDAAFDPVQRLINQEERFQ
jgi:hypothetical protein